MTKLSKIRDKNIKVYSKYTGKITGYFTEKLPLTKILYYVKIAIDRVFLRRERFFFNFRRWKNRSSTQVTGVHLHFEVRSYDKDKKKFVAIDPSYVFEN